MVVHHTWVRLSLSDNFLIFPKKAYLNFLFFDDIFLTPALVSWYETRCGYVPVLTIRAELSLVWLSCCLQICYINHNSSCLPLV